MLGKNGVMNTESARNLGLKLTSPNGEIGGGFFVQT